MPLVQLSNNVTFDAEPKKTVLDSAKMKGVFLEYSCRTGRCGVCKAHVLQGDTAIEQEEQALSAEDAAAGFILTCCRSALTDLELDIEDVSQFAQCPAKTLPCRIDSVAQLAVDVVGVVLRLPPNNGMSYLPGQYIDVIAHGVRRSYSIANSPRPDGKIELQIRQVEDGVLSAYWFGDAKANDLLRLEGPLGTFSLRTLAPAHLVFLATGTGIAPIKAILEQLAAHPERLAGKSIHVYWGGRTAADLYWQPIFNDLPLKFIPVLSRPDSAWTGRTGYIQQAVLDDAVTLGESVVYACGSDAMIHSARDTLVAAGLSAKNFYSDAFVSSN
ncbi:CDP-4-dehydro-6-deoxyglucose reductase [Pseudomonas sp. TE3786]